MPPKRPAPQDDSEDHNDPDAFLGGPGPPLAAPFGLGAAFGQGDPAPPLQFRAAPEPRFQAAPEPQFHAAPASQFQPAPRPQFQPVPAPLPAHLEPRFRPAPGGFAAFNPGPNFAPAPMAGFNRPVPAMPQMPPRAPAGYNPGPPPPGPPGGPKRQRLDPGGNQLPPAPPPFRPPNIAPHAPPPFLQPNLPPHAPRPFLRPNLAPTPTPAPAPAAPAPIPLHMHFKAMAAQLAANKQAAAAGQLPAGQGPVSNPPVPSALLARLTAQPAAPAPGGALPARPTQVQVTGAAGAQLPLNPQIDPKLLQEMQKKTDFFYEYRRGRGFAWDAEARRHIWSQLVIPVAKNYPTTRDLTAAHSNLAQGIAHKDQGAKNFFFNLGERRLKEKNKAIAVKPDVRKVINEHSGDLFAAGARFVRLLGAGGNGAACLYEITNQRTGATKRIVVKISLRGDDMKSEKRILNWLKHSRHITQLTSIAEVHQMLGREELGFPEQRPKLQDMPLDADTVAAIAKVDAAQSLLIQIFSNRGALDRMVSFLAYLRIPARDKFCWRLLECLVRGCIALWSPIRKQGQVRRQPVPLSAPLLTEQLPPMDENMLLNLVHFDLDVYNIFLTDDDQHPVMPMAQIGDFGTTRNMHSDHYRMHDICMWSLRHTGKRGYITPEQFAEEWDHVYRNPWKEAGRPSYKFKPGFEQVAGNYGMWTNIWSIGLTMWVIITQRAPLHPPVPREIPILPNMEADPNGVGRNTFWTYAYPLDQPGHFQIGDELRHLVLRMMAHDPYDRPSLKELLEAAEAGCALEDDDDPSHEQTDLETDQNIANFFRHYFGHIDPPPSDPVIPDPAKPLPSPPLVPPPVRHVPPPPGAGGISGAGGTGGAGGAGGNAP